MQICAITIKMCAPKTPAYLTQPQNFCVATVGSQLTLEENIYKISTSEFYYSSKSEYCEILTLISEFYFILF